MNPLEKYSSYGEKFFEEFFETFGVDLQEDIEIDLLDLHNEWMKQPNLYMKYAHLNAEVKRNRGYLFISENFRIRKELLNKNRKVVEATVRSELESSKSLIDIDYDLALVNAALKAMDIRKSALENEVKLYCGEYFSIPKENNIVKRKKKSPNKEAEEKVEKGVFNSKKRRE